MIKQKNTTASMLSLRDFFDKDDRGHFDMFCGSIKDISRYELWERDFDK